MIRYPTEAGGVTITFSLGLSLQADVRWFSAQLTCVASRLKLYKLDIKNKKASNTVVNE